MVLWLLEWLPAMNSSWSVPIWQQQLHKDVTIDCRPLPSIFNSLYQTNYEVWIGIEKTINSTNVLTVVMCFYCSVNTLRASDWREFIASELQVQNIVSLLHFYVSNPSAVREHWGKDITLTLWEYNWSHGRWTW